MSKRVPCPRFQRTGFNEGENEILTLVRVTSGCQIGHSFACADLDTEYPYLVEVCNGPSIGENFHGIFDLDGDKIDIGNAEWERVKVAPEEVVQQIEQGWECGDSVITRLAEES